MKQLAISKLDDNFFRTFWIQRLPKKMQAILPVWEDSLDKLALMADKIADVAITENASDVYATHSST